MKVPTSQVELVNQLAIKLKDMGIIHLEMDDQHMPNRRIIQANGQELLNFSSCNYVGLETDQRLKDAAIEAINQYGTQYYCVRAYMSLHHYTDLENMLHQIFGHPTVVMPTTMLGHLSIMPVLMSPNDAVILDHQVHTSVQMTAKILKANGTHIEMIRHNRMDYLESRIKKLSEQYDKVWYLADGVYSMYGNIAPVEDIHSLLQQYGKFHLYIDDSHGMSWTGPNGSGAVRDRIPFHPRMVLITSLGKAFGASGGVGVFYDEQTAALVRNTGSPLIFTGPLQPATLGAAVASAKIHLSDEIYQLQANLKGKIAYFQQKARDLGLPMVSREGTPIFFLGAGKPEVGSRLTQRLKERGLFSCLAIYPSVPYNNTGIRFLLTVHHTKEDIDLLLDTVAEEMPKIMAEENFSYEQIYKAFKMEPETGVTA
ncbi:MAG: 8-amino-7-oxononanoate synthase [Saprospirales bacterium]|nr:8-amino-7-oxononanoate synthase [Saprospirales bacterium]